MGNDFLDCQKSSYYEGHTDGQRIGQQQIIDATMIYMARLGRTREDAENYFKEVNAILDDYMEAFAKTDDQPIYQERMDEELKTILGDDMLDFRGRYPTVREKSFDKPIQEKKHPALKKRRKKH